MRRFHFSLRTLVCFALLCGSGVALWRNFDAWQITALLSHDEETLRGLAISPDGGRIATLSDSKLRVWNLRTGVRTLMTPLDRQLDYIPSFDFSPDGQTVMFTCRPNENAAKVVPRVGCVIELWNPVSGQKKCEIPVTEIASGSMRFSADGKRILNTFHLWEVNLDTQKEDLSIGLNTMNFMGVFPSPTPEQELKIRSTQRLRDLAPLTKEFLIRSTVSADGRIAATNIMDAKYTQVWDLTDGHRVCEIPVSDWNMCMSHNGAHLAARESPGSFTGIWDAHTGSKISKLRSLNGEESDLARCFSANGSQVAVVCKNEVVCAFDTVSGSMEWSAEILVDAPCHPRFFPDGSRFVCAVTGKSAETVLKLRDATNGRLLTHFGGAPDDPNGTSIWLVSPDGKTLVAEYDDSTAAVWQYCRPEPWWGVAWLPEFWITLICAVAFVWSVRREFRAKSLSL